MRWLSKKLDEWNRQLPDEDGHPQVHPIWFDPWKYRSREEVWRGLIAEVILRCIDVSEMSGPELLQRLPQAAKQLGRFLGKSFLHALSNTKVSVGLGEAAKVEFGGQAIHEIVEEFQRTNRPDKAYLNEFEQTLKYWVSVFIGNSETANGQKSKRLAVFIDDLDRCLPEVTLEVLEALKLYLNIPHLIFIVGLDRSIVDAVVRAEYSKHGVEEQKAAKYLDKMFQVEIDIPPSERVAEGFLQHQVELLDKITNNYWSEMLNEGHKDGMEVIHSAIRSLASHNPREIKRLLNSTLLRAHAAAISDSQGEDVDSKRALRFCQGAQVFLVHRILRRFRGAEAAWADSRNVGIRGRVVGGRKLFGGRALRLVRL
jgi:hypothetical protein